jgi:hypothetical protein
VIHSFSSDAEGAQGGFNQHAGVDSSVMFHQPSEGLHIELPTSNAGKYARLSRPSRFRGPMAAKDCRQKSQLRRIGIFMPSVGTLLWYSRITISNSQETW